METELRSLLDEISINYTDTLHGNMTQKNKIKNYKDGIEKIGEANKMLKKMREEIAKIESQDQTYSQVERTKDFIELLQLPGFRFNEVMTAMDILKRMANQLSSPAKIEECNIENNVYIESFENQNTIDVYDQ
jgi:hypothetical protein